MATIAHDLDALYWRDEMLQILFWFRGEQLGDAVRPCDLLAFLAAEETFVQQQLDQLAEEGYVVRETREGDEGAMWYRLTDWGAREAGRHFADEFAGLTGQAHGECNNPNCSCQTLGPEACASHTAHAH
ncbi:MAG: hypothetical protein ACR2JY_03515 [Chloroflexota bacterium]